MPCTDKVVILVEKDHNTWNALGRHGVGKCNSNDLLLLQMCTELNLLIGNTLFQQKDKYNTHGCNLIRNSGISLTMFLCENVADRT